MEIRDNRLYRDAGYTRFEDYCRERWGWNRDYANKQIRAAQVVSILDTNVSTPTTEAQARELGRLKEPDAIRETWQDVTERNPEPTAKDVRAAVERRAEATRPPLQPRPLHERREDRGHFIEQLGIASCRLSLK